MIGWKVWRALHRPFVAHPLYGLRGMWNTDDDRKSYIHYFESKLHIILIGLGLLSVILLLRYGFASLMILYFGVPVTVMLIGVPVSLMLVGPSYGLVAAVVTATTISRERYQGRFELLGTTPYGKAGATWALGSIAIQRNSLLRTIRILLPPTYFMTLSIILLPMLLFILRTLGDPGDERARQTVSDGLSLILITLFSISDFIQSSAIGGLVGMIVPTTSNQNATAYARAVALYLGVQVSIYVISIPLCIMTWPSLGLEAGTNYYIVCIATVFVVRELITQIIWRVLLWHLDAHLDDLDTIVHVRSIWRKIAKQ